MNKNYLTRNGEEVEVSDKEMLEFWKGFVEGQSKAVFHYSKRNRELIQEVKELKEQLEKVLNEKP